MPSVTVEHFKRAAIDIGAHGDNDTLPFDVDNRFISQSTIELANLSFSYFSELEKNGRNYAKQSIDSLQIFSERLLTPTGPAGFRITTKIHPFWNVYFNGLGVAIAEVLEPRRSERVHSYRYIEDKTGLFDRKRSWRAYREATIHDKELNNEGIFVVQTDISSFYERIYHHRLENIVNDIFPAPSTVSIQIDRILNQFSSGRSFGLPIGGQCARILAEVFMSSIDQRLSDEGLIWYRYVDDFTLITTSQADAYKAMSLLSHILADYGLSLNRTKTIVLTAKHFVDYVSTQLGTSNDESNKLREIDLHFDPYSDNPESDYEELKETVETLNIQTLLDAELQKAQPDAFLVAQIGRTLKLHSPLIALQLCKTLLDNKNLHGFRGSWSTIMRGIASLFTDKKYSEIFTELDDLLDSIPQHSPQLLLPESNCLHFLRAIRFNRTRKKASYVNSLYSSTKSQTVKRACIECWRHWHDRANFIQLRNQWANMGMEEQRMFWLAAKEFGDDGKHFRNQAKKQLLNIWGLGIETNQKSSFAEIYKNWCSNDA